jgi:hypothetical protein
MHPHLMYRLANERISELHRNAERARGGGLRRSILLSRRPSRVRRQAGWWLVSFGLRLAADPAAAVR